MAQDIAHELVSRLESSHKDVIVVLSPCNFYAGIAKDACKQWIQHGTFPDNHMLAVVRCLDNSYIEVEYTRMHEPFLWESHRTKLMFPNVHSTATFLMGSRFPNNNLCILHRTFGFIQCLYDEYDTTSIRTSEKFAEFLKMAFEIKIPERQLPIPENAFNYE